MKNVHLHEHHIEQTIALAAGRPQEQMKQFLNLLTTEQLDTSRPILYGYDSVRRIFWFRNDARGEIIALPLQRVRVWPEGQPW